MPCSRMLFVNYWRLPVQHVAIRFRDDSATADDDDPYLYTNPVEVGSGQTVEVDLMRYWDGRPGQVGRPAWNQECRCVIHFEFPNDAGAYSEAYLWSLNTFRFQTNCPNPAICHFGPNFRN